MKSIFFFLLILNYFSFKTIANYLKNNINEKYIFFFINIVKYECTTESITIL